MWPSTLQGGGRLLATLLVLLAVFPRPGVMVKQEDFKQCSQSAFCVRQRAYADLADITRASSPSPYELVAGSLDVKSKEGVITASLIDRERNIPFSFSVNLLERDTARVSIKESRPLKPRYELTGDLALDAAYPASVPVGSVKHNGADTTIRFGKDERNSLLIRSKPFSFELAIGGVPAISFNDKGYLYYEHWRQKKDEESAPAVENQAAEPEGAVPAAGSTEEKIRTLKDNLKKDLWEETFNGKTDSKPHGPASIGFDVSFLGSKNVYGIPQHATDFSLKSTRGPHKAYEEPYRMYNLDVFEYIMDSPMALYGSIPFMMSHKKGATAGIYWMNAAEMWVDVETHGADSVLSKAAEYLHLGHANTTTTTHWMAESGALDFFVFLGTEPTDIFNSFTALTGRPAMPQSFAIAYHQCRWNYMDEQDVSDVDENFDKYDIPYDVLWLDIEHTDGKRYFTWDPVKFANPVAMQENLASKGRKMVTIIDPHIKRDDNFAISKDFKEKGMFIKDKDGNDFDGWCWPGSSNWIDYTDEKARANWADKFSFANYKGSTPSLYTWNDMNEPSVFSGPETTMPKDALHKDNVEHRDVHNVYGTLFHRSTFQGHLDRNDGKDRPFILSRAFFAGTQRYGAIWTGDNFSKWSHLEASVPMLLTIGSSGVVFGGADVGGFFGNPEPDLLLRWYQVAAFQPFFRAHAHIDTKRREPWLFGEPYTTLIRAAIRQRYKILPYLYTLFEESTKTGNPVIRPMVSEFPKDEKSFSVGDQFMLGSGILVKPVITKDQASVDVYLPSSSVWYDYETFEKASPLSSSGIVTVKTPLEKIPIFLRGGNIIPRRERVRRSSSLMHRDPYTLWVALDGESKASGRLYADDGHSYDYQKGDFIDSEFTFSTGVLRGRAINTPNLDSAAIKALGCRVERIVLVGLKAAPRRAVVADGGDTVTLQVESRKVAGGLHVATVKTGGIIVVGEAWEIVIE